MIPTIFTVVCAVLAFVSGFLSLFLGRRTLSLPQGHPDTGGTAMYAMLSLGAMCLFLALAFAMTDLWVLAFIVFGILGMACGVVGALFRNALDKRMAEIRHLKEQQNRG